MCEFVIMKERINFAIYSYMFVTDYSSVQNERWINQELEAATQSMSSNV